jgi:hypothetical protein
MAEPITAYSITILANLDSHQPIMKDINSTFVKPELRQESRPNSQMKMSVRDGRLIQPMLDLFMIKALAFSKVLTIYQWPHYK